MATGRQIQLTKQVGEYLVAAELSRRGLLTTTFAGNVPAYDIVATGGRGQTALVQVKRRSPDPHGSSTSGHLRTCAATAGAQTMGPPTTPPAGDLICVLRSTPTGTERTASTCSAGRNSSACSSTATGTTWSATAAVAHGEPIPSTRPCGSRTSSRSWATGCSSTRSRRSRRLIAIGVDRSVWLDARGEDGSGPLVGPVQRAWVHGPVRRPVEPFPPVLPVANAGLGQRAARPAAARASVGAVAVVAVVVRGPAGPHGGAGAPAKFALRHMCTRPSLVAPHTSPSRRRRTFPFPVRPTRANVDGRRLPAAATKEGPSP